MGVLADIPGTQKIAADRTWHYIIVKHTQQMQLNRRQYPDMNLLSEQKNIPPYRYQHLAEYHHKGGRRKRRYIDTGQYLGELRPVLFFDDQPQHRRHDEQPKGSEKMFSYIFADQDITSKKTCF